MSVFSTASAAARPASALTVSAGYCINLRGRIEACTLCTKACHAGAISLGAESVSIDADRCVACGACVPVCPAGVFSHKGFDPETLLRTAVHQGVARIACAQASEPGASAIPCHRMLDARLLAALFAAGASEIEVVGSETCAGCPGGDARPALASAVSTLGKWFGRAAPTVTFAPHLGSAPPARQAIERRHLLRGAFRAFSPAVEPAASPPSFDDLVLSDDSEDALPRPVPYQDLLARARATLPFRKSGQVGGTTRQISDACSVCMACAELCPTGALADGSEDGQQVVSFDPALCTNCTLCLKICPMAAIAGRTLRGVPEAVAGRAPLFSRAVRQCQVCGGVFSGDSARLDVCPACENDREMEDDWLDMLSG